MSSNTSEQKDKLKIGILFTMSLAGNISPSVQRLSDEINKMGHESFLIDFQHCDLQVFEGEMKVFYRGQTLDHFDAIIPRIAVNATFYGLAVLRQFESMGIFCVNSSNAISIARDKLHSMQRLANRGVNFPKTVFTNNTDNAENLIASINGTPMIVKLLEGMQGMGTVLAESKKAAISVIEAFNFLRTNLILQEFIEESSGKDIRAFVVGDRVVASMERTSKNGDFRSNLHRGGSSDNIILSEEENNMAITAARILGLNVAGVDILKSKNGPLVIEVNSCPGLSGIEKTTGVNITKEIVNYIIKEKKS